MGDGTKIQWTDATWNPVRGCARVSEGCRHCYAEGVAHRFSGPGQPYEGLTTEKGRWNGTVRLVPEHLTDPLRWRKPRKVFVNSMSDLFHEAIPDTFIAAVWAVMAASPTHTFQVLTKRPERARAWLESMDDAEIFRRGQRADDLADGLAEYSSSAADAVAKAVGAAPWPLPNVWLGVSVEDQATANDRIPHLLHSPAAVRWVSYEPALERVDWRRFMPRGPYYLAGCERCGWVSSSEWFEEARYFDDADVVCPNCQTVCVAEEFAGLDWVVAGGESGPHARPCAMEWLISTVEQCRSASVPVFVKQMGACVVSEERRFTDPEAIRLFDLPPEGWAWRAGMKHPKGGDPSEWPEELRVREWPAEAVTP